MQLDSDFVKVGETIGRSLDRRSLPRLCLSALLGGLRDLVCFLIGHNLWRTGSIYRPLAGSLDVYTCHCRRCFFWGYVQGNYVTQHPSDRCQKCGAQRRSTFHSTEDEHREIRNAAHHFVEAPRR
jgi:hypothetical protein